MVREEGINERTDVLHVLPTFAGALMRTEACRLDYDLSIAVCVHVGPCLWSISARALHSMRLVGPRASSLLRLFAPLFCMISGAHARKMSCLLREGGHVPPPNVTARISPVYEVFCYYTARRSICFYTAPRGSFISQRFPMYGVGCGTMVHTM